MSLLTVEGFEVPVVPGTQLSDAPHGDFGRAFGGKMRSDIRASHRVGRIVGSYFDTDNDAPALRAILASPGPLLFGGTLIGDDAYFHVRNVEFAPITADLLQFSFDVLETDDSPSPLLFSFDGDAPGTYTFTRASYGRYTDEDGVLQNAGAHRARWENLWLDGTYGTSVPDTRAGLFEEARTNLVSSDNFDAGWTSVGTPVVSFPIEDPAGGTGAYRIADDAAGSVEYKYLIPTFTGNAVKSLVFVVREATMSAGVQELNLWDTVAAAFRLGLEISAWVAGAPTVAATAGTYLGKRYVGNGYWALYAQTTSVTAANTHHIEIRPAAVTAAHTGSIDVYRVNAYNATVPGWSIPSASEARAVDTWYGAFTHVPQAMTGQIDFIEGHAPTWAGEAIVWLGNSAGTLTRLAVYRTSGADSYTVLHNNGTTSVTAVVDISPSWGDRVRIRWVLNADGSVLIGAAKDTGSGFGAETVSSASSANALAVAWGDERVYLSHPTAVGVAAAYISLRFVDGVRTMAEMTDWARARLHPRIEPDVSAPLVAVRSVAPAGVAAPRVTIVPVLG